MLLQVLLIESRYHSLNILKILSHIFNWHVFNRIFLPNLVLVVRVPLNGNMVGDSWLTSSPEDLDPLLVQGPHMDRILELVRSSSMLVLCFNIVEVLLAVMHVSLSITK